MSGNDLAMLAPFLGISGGFLQRAPGQAHALAGDEHARTLEQRQSVLQRFAFIADHVGGGNAHIVEKYLGRRLAVERNFLDVSDLVRMFLAIEQKMRQAAARIVSGSAGADQEIRIHSVADPGLLACDDVEIAIALGARLDFQHVEPTSGSDMPMLQNDFPLTRPGR